MKPVRRAVIDVGTNSIKLLVADVCGHDVQPVLEDSKQTRLGKGFYQTHELQPAAIMKTAEAVKKFSRVARKLKAEAIRIIATSAARDAKNPRALITAINQASGLKVEIISGEQEAGLAFRGVRTNPALTDRPLLILDVGGGSTEFILGSGEHKHFQRSYPIGTVRLMEKLFHSDPPTVEELDDRRAWLGHFLDHEVRPELDPALLRELKKSGQETVQLVGTGGTASILAGMELRLTEFDRARIEAVRLSRASIRAQTEQLWSLPLVERKKIAGLPPNRADVILTGAVIYEVVMEQFNFAELRVSTRGLRFAAVMSEG